MTLAVPPERTLDEELRLYFAGDPELVLDPYPFFDRLREESPVRYDGPVFVVSSHEAVKMVQTDVKRFVSTKEEDEGYLALLSDEELGLFAEVLEFENLYVSSKNGADHTRIRRAMQPAFTPRPIKLLQEKTQELLDELLAPLEVDGEGDFMEIAYQLPLLVIMHMLGVPREDAPLLKQWGDELNRRRSIRPVPPEILRGAHHGMTANREYFEELIERQRRDPASELMGVLIRAQEEGTLTLEELVAMVLHLTFSGHETTTHLFGNGVNALMADRGQWDLLCSDPSLVPSAVEELLRFDAPVQMGRRVVADDLELGGVEIKAGTIAVPLFGAANRDPAVFDEPAKLDITRRPNDHLSLGVGAHFCLGGPLARMEGQIVFSTLCRRYPGMDFAGPTEHSNHPSLRGFTRLPVVLPSS